MAIRNARDTIYLQFRAGRWCWQCYKWGGFTDWIRSKGGLEDLIGHWDGWADIVILPAQG